MGIESEQCEVPTCVTVADSNFPSSLVQIIGGGGHCLFLDRNGNVFVCGWNNKGQLGLESLENSSKIQQISPVHFKEIPIQYIACGWDCSAAIANNGFAYVWGSNLYQQLGIRTKDLPYSSRPIKINLPDNDLCTRIEFGLRYTCFVTKHCIYIIGQPRAINKLMGNQQNNQIESINWNGIEWWKISANIECFASGQNHIVFCENMRTDQIQALGDNKYKQSEFIEMYDRVNILQSGWTHNGVLTNAGNVLLWGRNNYGQLGQNPEKFGNMISRPIELNCGPVKVKDLRLGAEHGLLFNEAGEIFTWGWNEHGNCGNNSTENV